jgi:putative transposase
MNSFSRPFWVSFSFWIQHQIKGWVKPTTVYLALDAISDLSRSKADLLVENALLRQQLIVLNRQIKRPKLTNGDRIRLVLLARCTKFWNQALHIIQPDTFLRWHRDLFRLYWRYISNNGKKKQRIRSEDIQIIRQMIQENKLLGAERIRGELLKLGISLSKRTIQKYIRWARKHLLFPRIGLLLSGIISVIFGHATSRSFTIGFFAPSISLPSWNSRIDALFIWA